MFETGPFRRQRSDRLATLTSQSTDKTVSSYEIASDTPEIGELTTKITKKIRNTIRRFYPLSIGSGSESCVEFAGLTKLSGWNEKRSTIEWVLS